MKRSKSSGSSRHAKPTAPKNDVTKTNLVRCEFDLDNLPPLTEEQKAELEALAAMPDEAIDYSDIPPLTDEFWRRAVRGRLGRPAETSTTLNIDTDVLAWLKADGEDIARRINAILRREMLAALKKG